MLTPDGWLALATLSSELFRIQATRRVAAIGRQRVRAPRTIARELRRAGFELEVVHTVRPITRVLSG